MANILELKKKLVKVKAEILMKKNKDLTAAKKLRRDIARLMTKENQ